MGRGHRHWTCQRNRTPTLTLHTHLLCSLGQVSSTFCTSFLICNMETTITTQFAEERCLQVKGTGEERCLCSSQGTDEAAPCSLQRQRW